MEKMIMKKSMFKKFVVSLMLVAMLLSSSVAFAAQTIDPEDGSTVDVTGTVEATTIIVTVPTSLSFAIDPNSETPLISVPATVVNGTYAPIDFQVLGITSD